MRIIAGIAKGRRLVGPKGLDTRPPTDRMREAIFSSLGAAVEGRAVLDLYAGTGAFGLEALSRGAASVTFVEQDRRALSALRKNIEAVGLGGRVVADDVSRALRSEPAGFELAFVDPPYALSHSDLGEVLDLVVGVLREGAIVLVHRRRDSEEPATAGTLAPTGRRRYGDAEVWWYEKEAR
jgi:16S rRNA (guanine966-N2)-methyltransferase